MCGKIPKRGNVFWHPLGIYLLSLSGNPPPKKKNYFKLQNVWKIDFINVYQISLC